MKCKVRLVNLSSKHALTASEIANRANNLEDKKRQEAEETLRWQMRDYREEKKKKQAEEQQKLQHSLIGRTEAVDIA